MKYQTDTYSAKMIELKGNNINLHINEELNRERLRTMFKGHWSDVELQIRFIDPRRFTEQQRRFVFALMSDIKRETSLSIQEIKDVFYQQYKERTDRDISLKSDSEATVSDINELVHIILDYIFEEHIPFRNGYEILPEYQEYHLYKCVVHRVCCICGKNGADIDHFDKALGRRSRNKVDHTEYNFAALCREHHQEKHNLGVTEFKEKYHIKGIKLNQEEIRKLRIGK